MVNDSLSALDVKYLLLEYYKRLGLNENDLAVILMINHLLLQKNTFITADLLSVKMNLSVPEIDKILVKLVNKSIIEYDTSAKDVKTTLNPLKSKLYHEFQISLAQESLLNEETNNGVLKNIYQVFEKEFGRTLSPIEFSMINEWVNYGYSDQLIFDALKEALSHNKKSLRAIDKILLQWQTRDDREKEGYSAISDKWNKDIEKSIEIARTKWIDDDK